MSIIRKHAVELNDANNTIKLTNIVIKGKPRVEDQQAPTSGLYKMKGKALGARPQMCLISIFVKHFYRHTTLPVNPFIDLSLFYNVRLTSYLGPLLLGYLKLLFFSFLIRLFGFICKY